MTLGPTSRVTIASTSPDTIFAHLAHPPKGTICIDAFYLEMRFLGFLVPIAMPCAIIYGMTLRIDKSGRIIFPKPLRDRLGLKPNMELEAVEQEGGGVLLRPLENQPSMIKVDGLWVHQGKPEPGTNWGRVVDDVREERIQSTLRL